MPHFSPKKKKFFHDKRLFLVLILGVTAVAFLVSRLFILQIIRGKEYSSTTSGRYSVYTDLWPERGEIFVGEINSTKLYPAASNKTAYLIYAEPSRIQNKITAARLLSQTLGLDELDLKKRLAKNDPYEPIAHYIASDIVEKIKSFGLLGIGFKEEIKRVYPEKGFGGHLLGFIGFDNEGLSGRYGLEGFFDKDLSGIPGFLRGEKDALGRLIPLGKQEIEPEVAGTSLVLTIDRNIQFFICKKIEEAVLRFRGDLGSIIVMNPSTGAILAMCSYPDFDPNFYNKEKDQSIFNNPAIFNQYEPGSIFKPITMAAAIDAKLVNPESTYNDTGSVYIKPHTIKNSDGKAYDAQTMTQVLEKSLNTGTVYLIKLLGPKLFRDYVENFGFGNLTGVELDGEAVGDISSLKKRGEIWSATASFGQGISVTPLQMLNSFNVLANGGKLMKPYLVSQKLAENGAVIDVQPQAIRQVISSKTSVLLRGMLGSVVENGHGKRAAVPGFYIAGKTGTAQVPQKSGGGYEEGLSIGSFIGFAPAANPVFSVLVKIDHPKTVEWAESSAAPVFGEVARYLLNYFKVSPER